MRLHFITRHLQTGGPEPAAGGLGTVAGAAAGFTPVGAILGGIQGALGIVQTISGDARAKRLLQQRTAYKTPEEYFKILNATKNLASQGFDPFTLNYLTNQTDQAFDSSLGAISRAGGDPNMMSELFNQRITQMMKIGAENHRLNMENFSKYLSALDVVGENKAAEWKSQQDLIKDKLQAAVGDKGAGIQNVASAANAFIGMDAARRTSNLYR